MRIINSIFALLITSAPALALDPGPRVAACDYKLSSKSKQINDVCLINSSIQMGVSFYSVKPISSSKVLRFWTNDMNRKRYKDGKEVGGDLKPIYYESKLFSKEKIIWTGTYNNAPKGVESQCRPGGNGADKKYILSNGGFVCLWF